MKSAILAAALALGVAWPAMVAEPCRSIGVPIVPEEELIPPLELKSLVLDNMIECMTLIRTSTRSDRFTCVDVVNSGARNFNRLIDMRCGPRMDWTGSAACKKLSKLPLIQLTIDLVQPR